MKYTFYKIKNKRFENMESWWVLVINNSDVLVEYQGFKGKDLVTSYFNAKKKLTEKNHLTGQEFCMLKTIANKKGRKTVVDDINVISDEMLSPLTRYFLDGKIPIVNVNGGYCFFDEELFEILEEVEKNEMIWPDDNRYGIKITRFPEGKHYYAKVGQYDVEDEFGNCKWNTVKEAERQAKKYLKELQNE